MALSIRPLDPSLRDDFLSVMVRGGPETTMCRCTAYYIAEWEEGSNGAAHRERLIEDGRSDGYLAYVDGQAVGWCQCAPLARFRMKLDPDPEGWGITCIVVVPERRGQKLARELVRAVLDDLRRRGVKRVVALAHRYASSKEPSPELPESVCREAGMTLERDHPEYPIYAARLES